MRLKNTQTHYGLVSKLLHWSTALSVIFLLWLGWYMVDLTYFDKWYNQSLSMHKSLGLLVLVFALALLLWKLVSPSPRTLIAGPLWQVAAARIMHRALIGLIIVVTISGYLISTSAGKPVPFFNLVDIPAMLTKSDRLRDAAIAVHFYLAYAIGVLAIGHAVAAIKHQLVDRDGTLARMLWR
jgi:cytochrome b561